MKKSSSKLVENTAGKGEIARYDLYCRHVKTRACMGKVEKWTCLKFCHINIK